ncbi:MAG: hypothetical protein Q9195_009160 [Heterodermia aff. obscurata]
MPGRGGRNRTKKPHHYWNHVARTKPEAQALATRLGLDFPIALEGFQSGLIYPIRRLIVTGEDNAPNFATLLGPLWQSVEEEIIKKTRIEVLLCPPPGSPSHAVSGHFDAGSPRWNPRAPNAEEEAEIKEVKDMKSKLAEQLGGRKDVDKTDVRALVASLGENWVDGLPALEAAMNSTNQDVRL